MSEEEQPATPKRSRKLAREMAFQALYSVDLREGDVADVVAETLERVPLATASERFFRTLVGGVTENQLSLDSIIVPCLANGWGIDRLAITDLTALRLGVFELEFLPGMPPKVSISEAVELATRYGSVSSGKFVNGLLSTVYKQSEKMNWDPSQEETPEPEDEYVTPAIEVDEIEVKEGTAEADELQKVSGWVLKSEE